MDRYKNLLMDGVRKEKKEQTTGDDRQQSDQELQPVELQKIS